MKNLSRLAAIALAVAGLTTSAHAAKKKTFDFSEFKGNYTGTATLTAGTQTVPGTATISVAVPKSGRSAIATVNAVLTPSNMSLPISNTFTFAANKSFSQSQLLYALLLPGVPASGTWSGKKTISFSGQYSENGTTAISQGTLSVRPRGKKHRRLTLSTQFIVPSQPSLIYNFSFDVTAKVKAPKK